MQHDGFLIPRKIAYEVTYLNSQLNVKDGELEILYKVHRALTDVPRTRSLRIFCLLAWVGGCAIILRDILC